MKETTEARKAAITAERNKYSYRGWVSGIAAASSFFIKRDRRDIAALLLSEFYIDRQVCKENDVTRETLEKRHVFDEQGKAIKATGRTAEQIKYFNRGWISGLVSASGLFVRRGRKDIAASLLSEFYINRQTCKENIVNRLSMETLEKYHVFDEQGKPMKEHLVEVIR